MCGRFSQLSSIEIIRALLKAQGHPDLFERAETTQKRYNVAPSQTVVAVRLEPTEKARLIVPLQWGLIPFWADDPAIGNKMINARAESVAEKPAFRQAFRRRRCLIPADGFYEWKKEGRGKQPYYIRMRDERLFTFAGLWERWEKDDRAIESCTILTTAPNELTAQIHNRMPVILDENNFEMWLDPDFRDSEKLLSILKPYPHDQMEAYPVNNRVNNPKNDDALCVERVG
ncbi:MAG: SOS response-associated peptidase [bacterium]